MSDLPALAQDLHLLRPGWLAALPVVALVWWRVRRMAGGERPAGADAIVIQPRWK